MVKMKVRQDLIYREKASFQVPKSLAQGTDEIEPFGYIVLNLLLIVFEQVPDDSAKLVRCYFS